MDAPEVVADQIATDQDNTGGGAASSNTPISSIGPDIATGQPRSSVKRPRPVKSCTECRKRKLRCDRLCPCSQCQKSHRVCKYSAADQENGNLSDASDAEVANERPAKRIHRAALVSPSHIPQDAPAVTNHAGADESPHGNSALLVDMAARLERLEKMVSAKTSQTTEWGPARHLHRVSASPVTIRGLSVKGDLRTRFFGQNSTKVLLNLFDEAKVFMHNMAKTEGVRELFIKMQSIYKALQHEHRRLLDPITVFVDSMMPVQKRMADILPKKAVCDRLLEAYIGASEGLYRVIHIPTFQLEYDMYWKGTGYSEGFLPRLLCMLSIGSRFETDSRGLGHDRSDSVHSPTACTLVRHWLDGLRGKQLVDVNTLQAEVLLLHAQRTITPRHQDSWTQLGFIVRMAMTMGLHRDPSEFPQISVFSGENRRKLWYTIMDMDLHVALACNLPCAIRAGEYSCKPPRNLNDVDIYPEMTELPEGRPIDQYTDTQMQAYAASTLPYRMRVSSIINRLDSIRDYDEVLEVGGKLERLLDDILCLFPRHHALDNQKKFKEWRMRALLDMHVRRPLLSLYRPFALSTANCPPHITSSYLKSSMIMLTYLDELDPRVPGFSDVNHMYQLVLKHDIIQAAFSVCYYIKNSPETSNSQWIPGTTPDSTEDGLSNSPDYWPMWSVPGLARAVEKTLESHIALIKDSSSDLKDVVALSIVLYSVQPGTPEQKLESIKAGIRSVLDASLLALNTKTDNISTIPITPTPPAATGQRQTTDIYMNDYVQTPYYASNELVAKGNGAALGIPDEFPLWDIDWWNPVTLGHDQS